MSIYGDLEVNDYDNFEDGEVCDDGGDDDDEHMIFDVVVPG